MKFSILKNITYYLPHKDILIYFYIVWNKNKRIFKELKKDIIFFNIDIYVCFALFYILLFIILVHSNIIDIHN